MRASSGTNVAAAAMVIGQTMLISVCATNSSAMRLMLLQYNPPTAFPQAFEDLVSG